MRFASFALASCLLLTPPSPAQDKPLRVLFIGNSYTWFNNLPHLVETLAKSAKEPRLVWKMVVAPGASLMAHWDSGEAPTAIASSPWDYVVLQDHSTLGLPVTIAKGKAQFNPRLFQDYAARFDLPIRKSGAKPILFLTWAAADSQEDQEGLTAVFRKVAADLGDTIAPVGIAFAAALAERPNLQLHQQDQSHPTPAGSYLAACVLYSVLYGKSPQGLPAHIPADPAGIPDKAMTISEPGGLVRLAPVNLTPAEATFLQDIAWKTVQSEIKK